MNKLFFKFFINDLKKTLPRFLIVYIFFFTIFAISDYFISKNKPKYTSKIALVPLSTYMPDLFEVRVGSFDNFVIQNFSQKIFRSGISESNFKECLPNKIFFGNIDYNKLNNYYDITLITNHKINNECINSIKNFILDESIKIVNENIKISYSALNYLSQWYSETSRPQITSLILKTNFEFYKMPELVIKNLNYTDIFFSIKKNLVLPIIFSIIVTFFFFSIKRK